MFEESQTNEECPLSPLDSALFVMERARNVSIDRSKIDHLAKQMTSEMMDGLSGTDDDQRLGSDIGPAKEWSVEKIVDWLFFVTTLNFSFWLDSSSPTVDHDESYSTIYKSTTYFGYQAFCASVNRALDNGIKLIDARFYSKVTVEQLEQIFNWTNDDGPVELPLINERQMILNQTGTILVEQFDGHFLNCLQRVGNNAIDLLQFVVRTFPCYRDETFYDGQKVSFYKRAQILIADIWGLFKGRSVGHFTDLDHLTMFADYRVPQVLSHQGILVYSDRLKQRLERKELIEFGEPDEVEIRAASILAVHWIVNQVNEKIPLERDIGDEGQRINSILVDVFLWRRRRLLRDTYKTTAFHRTRSIFY